MTATEQTDTRRRELGKIHLAAKQLGMDENTYREMLFVHGGARSAADLDDAGRHRVLMHLRSAGFRARLATWVRRGTKRVTAAGDILASDNQVRMLRSIWIQLADAGVVKNRAEPGLRAWIQSATRRYHPQRTGYSAPEFLPEWVAQRTAEHLKQWARRCAIKLLDDKN